MKRMDAATKTRSVLIVVLLVGYGMYGGLALATAAVHETVARDDPPPVRALDGRNLTDDRAEAFAFAPTVDGFEYAYNGSTRGSYMDALSNAGVYAGDYDDDGWPDLLAVGGTTPVLYENTGGRFEPSGALPALNASVRSATFLDYDRDADLDILLLALESPPILLENDEGTFERTGTFEEPLPFPFGTATADYNDDGHLDLFVYQYGDFREGLPSGFRNYSAPVNADNGNRNVLYRGTGSGFERVDAPAINGSRWSLAATFLDLTGDGRPDIHVANDFNHDVLYANRGNGSFERIILPERTNRNGMSSEVADVSGDGRPDLFVTNIYYPDYFAETRATPLKARGNYLLVSRTGGSFAVQSSETAIHAGGWGWASVLADLDNDADQDLFHTTTRLTFRDPAVEAQLSEEQLEDLRSLSFYHRPAVWAYDRGDSFQKVSAAASGFGEHDGRGVARLDYDRDGDLDLAVATASEYRLYENRLDEPNAIQVRVLGPEGSPVGAYGATVRVNTTHTQTRWVHARSDFLSQDSRLVHVGVGDETTADVTVVWPDGTTRVFEDVTAGTRLVVTPEGIRTREAVSRDESE